MTMNSADSPPVTTDQVGVDNWRVIYRLGILNSELVTGVEVVEANSRCGMTVDFIHHGLKYRLGVQRANHDRWPVMFLWEHTGRGGYITRCTDTTLDAVKSWLFPSLAASDAIIVE
jgi:hypothetical protein